MSAISCSSLTVNMAGRPLTVHRDCAARVRRAKDIDAAGRTGGTIHAIQGLLEIVAIRRERRRRRKLRCEVIAADMLSGDSALCACPIYARRSNTSISVRSTTSTWTKS